MAKQEEKKRYNNEDYKALRVFFQLLSICHTVFLDQSEGGKNKFQASSPDELALVEGA